MKSRYTPCAGFLAVVLSGCLADAKTQEPPVLPAKVFKYDGSKQCEKGGIELDTMRQELTKGGVDVVCAHKGHDGRMRIQMCGADTGKMNLFVIPANQLQQAQSLGFTNVKDLKGYMDSECK